MYITSILTSFQRILKNPQREEKFKNETSLMQLLYWSVDDSINQLDRTLESINLLAVYDSLYHSYRLIITEKISD